MILLDAMTTFKFVGCSKSDFLLASISLLSLHNVSKKQFLEPAREERGKYPFEASFSLFQYIFLFFFFLFFSVG